MSALTQFRVDMLNLANRAQFAAPSLEIRIPRTSAK
jgi:hypothetical protein